MGQKKSKSSLKGSTETLSDSKLLSSHTMNISSTFVSTRSSNSLYSQSTLSKSKSCLESRASNDSGCYSEKSLESTNKFPVDHLRGKDATYLDKNLIKTNTRKQNIKAEVLCEQINQILSKSLAQQIEKKLIQQEATNKSSLPSVNRSLRRTFSEKNLKNTLSKQPIRSTSRLGDIKYKLNETLVKTMPSMKKFDTMKSNKSVKLLHSDSNSSQMMMEETETEHKTLYSTTITQSPSNTLLSYGRRIASFRRSRSRNSIDKSNSVQLFDKCSYYETNKSNGNSRIERVTNLIAAKLLAENIDLAKVPFSDEMGFCMVPRALVKRYASELKESIETIAKCMENERINQLEKSGKIAIPNDFHLSSSCFCEYNLFKPSGNKRTWHMCECDIDVSDMGKFFHQLGLPMYAEVCFNKRFNLHLNDLLHMNRCELVSNMNIKNKTHLLAVWTALDYVRSPH